MNIVTIILPFFNFWEEGLITQGSRYMVEERKKKRHKKSTKHRKMPSLTIPQEQSTKMTSSSVLEGVESKKGES